MAKILKIGIVGSGAIGSSLAKIILKDFSLEAKLSALYDIDQDKAKNLSFKLVRSGRLAEPALKDLINDSDFVIEASSAGASLKIAQQVLLNSKDIMIMSVGGIVGHLRALAALARKNNSKVYIPSGATSGVDALKAANLGEIKSVTLTTRKNPLSFAGNDFVAAKGIELENVKKDTVLFKGSAKLAIRYFPQNINVAGILSLAGIGEKKTIVKIMACPRIRKNVHEVEIISQAAKVFTRTENIVHPDNPKTSYLAVLSAVACLRQVLAPVRIGT